MQISKVELFKDMLEFNLEQFKPVFKKELFKD